jgi:serine/threonine-protein kinase
VPPRRLRPKVPRDLETICLKCLHKEPARRYPSAADLADDLHRLLTDAPIQARPVGRLERLGRWCRRNPALAGLAAVSALAVLGLVIGVVWHDARLGAALRAAEEQRDKARERYLLARAAVDEMLTRVGQERLRDIPEMEPVRREL